MVLIYSHTITNRLQYICSFIFEQLLQVTFYITTNKQVFEQYDGAKINYSNNDFGGFIVQPTDLLFNQTVEPIAINCFMYKGNIAFFKTTSTVDYGFDVFAASFYLISRYEEYLPHTKDMYGRYAHQNSLAYKQGFLHLPLVNIWIMDFIKVLQNKYPNFTYTTPKFTFVPTYDIDIAYSYKHKGVLRNIGAFIQQPTIDRIVTLLGKKNDPFDTYHILHQLHLQYHVQPIYFFLVAQKNGLYDKNILPKKIAMQQLIAAHNKLYTIGIHPSWQSGDDTLLLKKEKELIEKIIQQSITISRQHYIRFNLPMGYQQLIDAAITHDYSMGYGSINGFRASVATPFYWYNLSTNQTTKLLVHPFCFMDANALYEQHFTAAEAYTQMMEYYQICKTVGGCFITIWHNHFLSNQYLFKNWQQAYTHFLSDMYNTNKI
jgi:hypothetical protein